MKKIQVFGTDHKAGSTTVAAVIAHELGRTLKVNDIQWDADMLGLAQDAKFFKSDFPSQNVVADRGLDYDKFNTEHFNVLVARLDYRSLQRSAQLLGGKKFDLVITISEEGQSLNADDFIQTMDWNAPVIRLASDVRIRRATDAGVLLDRYAKGFGPLVSLLEALKDEVSA